MNSPIPNNPLDEAILALRRSRSAFPDLCRRLCEGELFLLIRYQPDLVDATIEIKGGAPFPFVRFVTDQGETVPAFTSEERAQEGLARGKVPDRSFVIGAMTSREALELVGKVNLSMTLNKGCATGEVLLPPDLLRDLASGTALKPRTPSGQVENITLNIVQPENYPTETVQAAFEMCRKHVNFRAAWLFTRSDKPEAYYLMLVMEPRDDQLLHDFSLVVASAAGKAHPLQAQAVDESNLEQIATMFKVGRPFYQAVDFPTPPGIENQP